MPNSVAHVVNFFVGKSFSGSDDGVPQNPLCRLLFGVCEDFFFGKKGVSVCASVVVGRLGAELAVFTASAAFAVDDGA